MHNKHFLSLVLLIFILSLAACGGGKPPVDTDPVEVATEPPTDIPHKGSGSYDPFEGSLSSAHPWTWKGENPAKWSLSENPGFLRIYAGPYATEDEQNILLREAPSGNYTITTHVLFEPVANFQVAGLTVFVENGIKVIFGRSFCSFIPPCVGNGITFDYLEEGAMVGSNFPTETAITNEAWLRLERVGDALTGSYSADGETWQVIGTHTLSPSFQSARIGLFAGNDMDKSDADIPADFDFFDLTSP